ncbi:hypothetical protein GCM10009118_03470 [Wandonia haliotis]|uniref:Ankyrin repeat protein n=2 Tax=Wandonia haliotis TaxID=574963 RepID=A0ABN1ML21_9FLAO
MRHKKGADALFKAIHQNNVEMVEILLQNGADPYLKFKNYTNYEAAIEMSCDKEILKLLLSITVNIRVDKYEKPTIK